MNYKIRYSDELYHYGVKGMKWGVRKDERVSSAESNYRGAKSDAKQARKDAASFSRRHAISSRIKGTKNNRKAEELRKNAERKTSDASKAKDKLSGTKNLVKAEKYRDKLAGRSKNRASWEVYYAKQAQHNVNDLKKHGAKADVYQERRTEALNEQKRKYEERFGENSYNTWASLADTMHYDWNTNQRVRDMIKSERDERNSHINTARRYLDKRKALMEMPISEVTTKKDIRRVYKGD